MKDGIKVRGRFQLLDMRTGKMLRDDKNLIMDLGKEWVAARLKGDGDPINYIHVGTGTIGDDSTRQTLVTTFFQKVLDIVNGTVTANTIQYVCTLAPGEATGPLTESGLMTKIDEDDVANVMLARKEFLVVNKLVDDQYQIIWTITAS